MRIQTSASVFGASDAVFMGSILPLNGAPLQENDAMARNHVRLAQRLFRACRPSIRNRECQCACCSPSLYGSWRLGRRFALSRDGGQVVDLFQKMLLQAVVAQLLRQGKEAVWVLDE